MKGKTPLCTLTPVSPNAASVSGSTVNLSWTGETKDAISYLNISTSEKLKDDSTFENGADIANDIVVGKTSYTLEDLPPGTYFWNVVSDGCKPVRRRVSKVGSFTIKPGESTTCIATAATLNQPEVNGSKVTLGWTKGENISATYIGISTSKEVNTDGTLKKLDVVNDATGKKTQFIRDNLPPKTYYWSVISDGCRPTQRKVSEIGSFEIVPTF